MRVCCCILAGTKACENCMSSPSKSFTTFVPSSPSKSFTTFIPITQKREIKEEDTKKFYTWTTIGYKSKKKNKTP